MTTPGGRASTGLQWPTLAASPGEIASFAIPLILERERWIHRQVETLTFLDADRMWRHVSVDFTVPAMPSVGLQAGSAPKVVYLPIALLIREVMENFDLRDEQGAALPCLTTAQHSAVARRMLVGASLAALAARRYKNPDRDAEVKHVVETLCAMIVDRSSRAKRDWQRLKQRQQKIRDCILENETTQTLIDDLRDQFPVFVPVLASAGDRRVLKFSLEIGIEQLPEPKRAASSVPDERWGGMIGRKMVVDTPIAGRAESVHIEIPAPEELYVAEARLYKLGDERGELPIVPIAEPAPVAHLHPETAPKRGTEVKLRVKFVLRRDGLVTAGALLTATTTLLLTAGLLLHLMSVSPRTDAAVAVVVALPAIYAPVLATSSAHRLVQRIVRASRTWMLISAAISFIAAASLGVDLPANDRAWLWLGLWIASLLPAVRMATAWRLAPR